MKKDYPKAIEYLNKAIEHGANAKNDIVFAWYENFLYYRSGLYEKTITSVEKAFALGEKYRDNDNLKKVYELAKSKQDSIQSIKL